jgi:hypothetical protein
MAEAETPPEPTSGIALPPPENPELPADVIQAFVEVDRKCGVFIFPQLRQLGAETVVEEVVAAAAALAQQGSMVTASDLAQGYRDLLARAQAVLREARTKEVEQEADHRDRRQSEAKLAASLLAAKSRLPPARLARLQQRLGEVAEEGSGEDQLALVDQAVADWEHLSQVRQSREAERLADRAHLVVRPRQQETARSRRALREQAQVVALARAFAIQDPEPRSEPSEEESDQ